MGHVLAWFQSHPVVGTLCLLMALDVVMGLIVAFGLQNLNSSFSRIGMVRKVATIILVAVAFIIEPYSQGVPTGQLTALAFTVSELISVIENSAKIGLPVPKPLTEALSKLRGEKAPPFTL